ncbi:hypothetical protein DV736_g2285, partial [Chaetothyriales sp. CBS 134916]
MSKRAKGKGKEKQASTFDGACGYGSAQHGLAASMQQLSVNSPSTGQSMALHRPLPSGKNGQALTVLTNHFKLSVDGLPATIYSSNVKIHRPSDRQDNKAPISSAVRRRVLQLLLYMPDYRNQVYTDYDKVLVSFFPLTDNSDKVVTISYYDREEKGPRTGPDREFFDVIITPEAPPLPTQPLKQLLSNNPHIPDRGSQYEEALNLILQRHVGQSPDLISAARDQRVFSLIDKATQTNLSHGLIAYRGYIRRARLLYAGLRLCVNTTTAAMYEHGSLTNLIKKYDPRGPPANPGLQINYVQKLNTFLRRLRIQGNFGKNQVKHIASLAYHKGTLQTVSDVKFVCSEHPVTKAPGNLTISVKEWFEMVYKKTLNPRGCVVNVGSKGSPTWWPVDLCTVPEGQFYKSLLPFPEQERNMIQVACKRPQQNINFIENEGLQMLGIRQPPPADFPLHIEMKMSTIDGRRIDSPTLQFGGPNQVKPQESCTGQWNLRNRKFRQGAVKPWTVVVFQYQGEPGIKNLKEFKDAIKRAISGYCGIANNEINIGVNAFQRWPITPESSLRTFFNNCRKAGVRYCFVVPSDPKWYSAIKRAADKNGIQTTVTLRKQSNTVKDSPGEIANLMMKYNIKCGGINWTANISSKAQASGFGSNIMFMGADVIHPPAGAMIGAPSCAALVASVTPEPAQFPGHIELQHNSDPTKKSEEMILNLDVMAASRLRLWKTKNNNRLPELIIMYRDGVSDGQFQQSLEKELPLLRKACETVYGESHQRRPRIIWQVCKKDHPARFYAPKNNPSNGFDQHRNPSPGLVVDTSVVTRDLCDWYAVPHKAIQGTAKPTHHYLLHSDVDCTSDSIQGLTHYMSFIFSRSVTSISNPSPARLADRLCDRAKHHLYDVYYPDHDPTEPRPQYNAGDHFKGQSDIHQDIRDTMYYL